MSAHPGLDIVAVLPGAASLGAYQAGAAAAVLAGTNALRDLGHDVTTPAWGGASAGATVSLLAAHATAHGLDPVKLMHRAWVERVDLDVLTEGTDAPLGTPRLRSGLVEMLHRGESLEPDRPIEQRDVSIHVALTTLRGYRYRLHHLGAHPADAVTYADWTEFRYGAGQDPRLVHEPEGSSLLDAVMASLANPAVFAPTRLDRSDSFDDYRDRGLDDVAGGADAWWFVDGYLVQSRPIHRTLALVPPSDRDVRCVLIDPRSEGPSTGRKWADPSREPAWVEGLSRALSIFPAQVFSDELRRLDENNRSIAALAELADFLEVRDQDGWRAWASERGVDSVADGLMAAAGIDPSRIVRADVIQPLLVAESDDVPGLLAGELMGDFAGFLSRDLRQSDFSLGYACATKWWERTLPEHDLEDHAGDVTEALAEVGPPHWEKTHHGEATLSDLPLRQRARLARVAARALRALFRR